MNRIPTAIIGVGSLGQHHARILSQHPLSHLLAIIDTDEKRREKIGSPLHVPAYAGLSELPDSVRAAVVAVPTSFHYAVAKDLLGRGIHCLVEKPFTSTVEEAEELISIARARNLILQVGHVERFNPAVVAAQKYIKSPRFIEVNRLGPYDPRSSSIGVVLDLMIHDLDILLTLLDDKVVRVEAHGAKILSQHEDIAKVRLTFSQGCVADLSASRVTLDKYRKIRIFQNDRYISVDYAGKSLKVYQKKAGVSVVQGLGDVDVLKPSLKDVEPLYEELGHFLSCVIEGKKPAVSGEHGRDALELALEITRQLKL